ncbi:TPA: hypothetical protein ACSPJ7_001502 [Bacillus cereus]
MGAVKSVQHSTRKTSKHEREMREEMEDKYVTDKTSPTIILPLSKDARKIFNKLKKRNEHFTQDDSASLTALAFALSEKGKSMELLQEYNPLSDEYRFLTKNISDYDKQAIQHMTALSIPLKDRLRLANEMTKIAIEEKKLQAMNQPQEQVNPNQIALQQIIMESKEQ